MKPEPRFLLQPKDFWANVRLISAKCGYTVRNENRIKVPTLDEIAQTFTSLGMEHSHLVSRNGEPTHSGRLLLDYFDHRASVLLTQVEPNLMDADTAREVFRSIKKRVRPKYPLPMNKQKGKKSAPAYLTGIINMLIEENCAGLSCDFDPRDLTTITRSDAPLRTLARRVDGCFPTAVNPVAIWEIKEYYYTTTFGSRIADGIYETLLDGMELEELRSSENIDIKHYFFADAYYTWWECGRSYLCRLVDMLHMGYVDEVLFGREVVERLPALVGEWVGLARTSR